MKKIISSILLLQLLSACSSDKTEKNIIIQSKQNIEKIDSSLCFIKFENKNLLQVFKLFEKEELSNKGEYGVLSLRVYSDETLRKFYGLSVLRTEIEFNGFAPICCLNTDTSQVLIKIDAVKTLFKPLNLNQIKTNRIQRDVQASTRNPFWLLEERNDSIIVIEKRMN